MVLIMSEAKEMLDDWEVISDIFSVLSVNSSILVDAKKEAANEEGQCNPCDRTKPIPEVVSCKSGNTLRFTRNGAYCCRRANSTPEWRDNAGHYKRNMMVKNKQNSFIDKEKIKHKKRSCKHLLEIKLDWMQKEIEMFLARDET